MSGQGQPPFAQGENASCWLGQQWIPLLVSTGGGAPVYQLQWAVYDIIANRLFFDLAIQLSALGTLAAGTLTIAGPPFNDANPVLPLGGTLIESFVIVGSNLAAGIANLLSTFNHPTQTITLSKFAAGAAASLTQGDLTATTSLRLSGNYRIY